jgi:2-keto-4-pentenoate hydratase
MSQPVDRDAIADQLADAYSSRVLVAPLTGRIDGLSVDDAYAIQQLQTDRRVEDGAGIVGFKVGLTSAAMQQQLGIDQPDYGHLFADMQHAADAPIATGDYLAPRAEPEIALVLAKPLRGTGIGVADIIGATAYVLPAIEIIDSRIADWRIGLLDTIADNASSGGFVLGATPTPLAGLDLALTGCVFRRNGRILSTGTGAAVLGSPLYAAAWLANTLTARGVELNAGHVILTGSLTAAVPVGPGDSITATLAQLGSVTAIFD